MTQTLIGLGLFRLSKKGNVRMFADRAKIFIRSGKGGDGHVSFRRELYVPTAVLTAATAAGAAM